MKVCVMNSPERQETVDQMVPSCRILPSLIVRTCWCGWRHSSDLIGPDKETEDDWMLFVQGSDTRRWPLPFTLPPVQRLNQSPSHPLLLVLTQACILSIKLNNQRHRESCHIWRTFATSTGTDNNGGQDNIPWPGLLYCCGCVIRLFLLKFSSISSIYYNYSLSISGENVFKLNALWHKALWVFSLECPITLSCIFNNSKNINNFPKNLSWRR